VRVEDDIHYESNHADEVNSGDMAGDLCDGFGDNVNYDLGDNPSEPEPSTQCEIACTRKMTEEQREMVNNSIQQNTQLCAQNAELMEPNREYYRESIRVKAMRT